MAALYLVTGGAGFIGSHLTTALLDAGYGIRIFDNVANPSAKKPDARCELIYGDVANEDQIRAAMLGVSGCFHLAAVCPYREPHPGWYEQRDRLG
jgi:UDP-glucose 4-epimerase